MSEKRLNIKFACRRGLIFNIALNNFLNIFAMFILRY